MKPVCSNCRLKKPYSNGLCRACYNYKYKFNRTRPDRLWDGTNREKVKPVRAVKQKPPARCLCGQLAIATARMSIRPMGKKAHTYDEPLCAACLEKETAVSQPF